MSDRPKIFDQIFASEGGRFPQDAIDPQLDYWLYEMRSLIEILRQREEDKPEIYLDLIANSTLNACVTKQDDVYYIGINYGGLYIISDLFFRMLSCPDVLPEFGDVSKEITRKIPNAQITDLRQLYLAKHSDETDTPIDPTRTELAKLLTLFCVNFMSAHEYGHISLGHIDHLLSIKPTAIFFEGIEDTLPTGISPIFQQIKELEADSFTIGFALNMIRGYTNIGEKMAPELYEKLKNFETRLYLWHFAVYTFWRVFGARTYSYDDLPTWTHLPPGFRQEVAMAIARTSLRVYPVSGFDLPSLQPLFQKSVLEVEKAFSAISDQPFNMDAYVNAFHEKMQGHYDYLKSQYDAVHVQLAPL